MQERQCDDGSVHDEELWADIRGYEGRYQVSTLGRVKSLARMRRGKSGASVPVPEIIMRLSTKNPRNRTRPYVEVRLRNGGSREEPCKAFLVHRLVADAFIKCLEPGEQVDHINGVHGDNRAENLRVMTYVEHGRRHPLIMSGELNRLRAFAFKIKMLNGWKPGQYVRTSEMRERARQHALAKPRKRDDATGQFVSTMPGPMKDEKGRPTRKAASLKRWGC